MHICVILLMLLSTTLIVFFDIIGILCGLHKDYHMLGIMTVMLNVEVNI